MAEVKAFRGVLYNPGKIGGDLSGVVAPPYDVISEKMRDELYGKNEHNIIRLILGKALDGDDGENKYTRARKYLDEWQADGVLARDDEKAFYVYLQEYPFKGQLRRRMGFMGLMKIGETSSDAVLPHERTHAKPKEDRMNLIKQVKSNLSPIFTLYHDNTGEIKAVIESAASGNEPAADIELDGVRHKLWRLSDADAVRKISGHMSDKKLFIADGHHRYEVARAYRDLRREEKGYDGRADHVMVYFTDMADPGNLTVMATHRAIKQMPLNGEKDVRNRLAEYFDIDEYDDLAGLMGRIDEGFKNGKVFGFYGGSKFLFMKPKAEKELLGLIEEERTDDWKHLDVSILHSAVLNKILSVDGKEGNITYVRDPEDAESLVRGGSHKAAFFLNPTRVEQLKAVAEHGEMMPQKSTYFYPKLLTGLVINRFGE